MRIELTPSGVEAIDSTLGGLIANDITLVCGPPRSGKTIAGLNHIIALLRQASPVLLVTTDLPESVIQLADGFFEFDIRPEIDAKRLTILTLAPNFTNRLRSLGTVARAFDELAMLCEERHIKHVVFDTIDPVLAAITVMNVKRFVQEALSAVRRMGVTLLCTSRAEGSDALKMGVQELAAGVATTLGLDGGPSQLLVQNAAWSGMSGSTVPVHLVAGRGLVSAGDVQVASEATTNPPMRRTASAVQPAPAPQVGGGGRWSNQVNTLHVDSTGGGYAAAQTLAPDPMHQATFGQGGGGGGGGALPAPRRGGIAEGAAQGTGQRGGLDAMPTAGVNMRGFNESRTMIGGTGGQAQPMFDDSEGSSPSTPAASAPRRKKR